jgi:hypothetical protein
MIKLLHMYSSSYLLVIIVCCAHAAQPAPQKLTGEDILKASEPQDKARAYKKLFQASNESAFEILAKDQDTGIALQAAWEQHKKLAKRDRPLKGRADDIYDPAGLKEFVTFLKKRVQCPVPEWWSESIVDIDVKPGIGHSFQPGSKWPELKESTAGGWVPKGADLVEKDGSLVFTQGKWKLSFTQQALGIKAPLGPGVAASGAWNRDVGALAIYTPAGGMPCQLVGFKNGGGEPIWKSEIWAVNRSLLIGVSPHCLEVVATEDSFFVFGQETFGMYIEAFESATGKCRFRFCTCYWFIFSEKWNLK